MRTWPEKVIIHSMKGHKAQGGNRSRKTTSTEGLTQDSGDELKDYHQLPPIPTGVGQQLLHPHQQPDRSTNQHQVEENKGSSDDFEAVQRNADILKSFRRAPPPKNRTRARRSGRRRPQGANETVESIAEGHEDEEQEFESSLHMQPATPQSSVKTAVKPLNRPKRDTTDLLNRDFVDSPQSLRASLRSQQESPTSHLSDYNLKQPKQMLSIDFNKDFNKDFDSIRSRSFSEGLSSDNNKKNANINTNINTNRQKQPVVKQPQFPQQPLRVEPFKYSINPANVTLSSLRRDLPIGKRIDVNHNGHHSNSINNIENWSPQPQRPVSVAGVPMRRWASEHNPSGVPVEVPRSPLLDVHKWSTHSQSTTNKDTTSNSENTTGRKNRYDEAEERIYPKSEKLLRKAIGSIPGNFTPPPNLLYRPYYHTSSNVNNEYQFSNEQRQYQRTRSESWVGNPSSVFVHFNIDTEPTNV